MTPRSHPRSLEVGRKGTVFPKNFDQFRSEPAGTPGRSESMTEMLTYPQRVQLALLVLFASLCLNFGSLLGSLKQRSTPQVSSVRVTLPRG